MPNTQWDATTVAQPCGIRSALKNRASATAVMTSGVTKGSANTPWAAARVARRQRRRPSAAIVPSAADIELALAAMAQLAQSAFHSSDCSNNSRYPRSEKLVQTVLIREPLNE